MQEMLALPACQKGLSPEQKELAGEAECLLFNPQFPSWHTLPISALLPFPGNLQSEQLKPAGITNWCLEATFAGGDVYRAAQRDSTLLAGVLCQDNKLTWGACVYLKGFRWEKQQNTCPPGKMQTLPSEESFDVDNLEQF